MIDTKLYAKTLPVLSAIPWGEVRRGTSRDHLKLQKKEILFRPMPEVLTIEDLGDYLRIGRNGAYNLIHANQIRHIRIGKQIRIPRKAVEDFLSGSYF